jgi:hypothetical protein
MKSKIANIVTFIKYFLLRLKAFLPTELPRTPAAFEALMNSVKAHGLPGDSVNCRFAVSTGIMHLPAQCVKKPVRYFVKSIMKLQANEVAYDVLEAARKAQQSPVATPVAAVPNASTQIS